MYRKGMGVKNTRRYLPDKERVKRKSDTENNRGISFSIVKKRDEEQWGKKQKNSCVVQEFCVYKKDF